MGTPVVENVEEQILLLTETADVATLSGTIPAPPANQVIVIDWINGWCINPSAGAGYGTTIDAKVVNSEANENVHTTADGFGGAANEVRSSQDWFLSGIRMTSTAAGNAALVGTAATFTVTIDGATNDGAGHTNLLGGSVGFHYELAV